MAASPAPSPDGSYGTYPSSGHSTPQPGTNCVFVPIDLPADSCHLSSSGNNNNSNSSNNNSKSNNNNNRIAMCDLESAQQQSHVQGQTQMTTAQSEAHYLHVATSDGGGSHFTMADVNVSSPQITWSTGSDGMSFTFSGVPTAGTMTSTSECSYASSVDDLDDQRSTGDETSKPKPKRRRVITKDQRRAANQRERRRMVTLNDAFDMLKQRIPTFTHEKKLSRIETLRLAISYIGFMGQLVDGKHPSDVTAGLPFIKSDDDQSGHGGLADVIDNYSYVMHESAMAPADSMATMDAAAYVTDMSQYHHNGYYSNGGFMTQ